MIQTGKQPFTIPGCDTIDHDKIIINSVQLEFPCKYCGHYNSMKMYAKEQEVSFKCENDDCGSVFDVKNPCYQPQFDGRKKLKKDKDLS